MMWLGAGLGSGLSFISRNIVVIRPKPRFWVKAHFSVRVKFRLMI